MIYDHWSHTICLSTNSLANSPSVKHKPLYPTTVFSNSSRKKRPQKKKKSYRINDTSRVWSGENIHLWNLLNSLLQVIGRDGTYSSFHFYMQVPSCGKVNKMETYWKPNSSRTVISAIAYAASYEAQYLYVAKMQLFSVNPVDLLKDFYKEQRDYLIYSFCTSDQLSSYYKLNF